MDSNRYHFAAVGGTRKGLECTLSGGQPATVCRPDSVPRYVAGESSPGIRPGESSPRNPAPRNPAPGIQRGTQHHPDAGRGEPMPPPPVPEHRVSAAVDQRRADHRARGGRRSQPGPGARLRNHPVPGAVHDRERDARQMVHRIARLGPRRQSDRPRHPVRPARCSATRPPREWPTSTTGNPGPPVRDLLAAPSWRRPAHRPRHRSSRAPRTAAGTPRRPAPGGPPPTQPGPAAAPRGTAARPSSASRTRRRAGPARQLWGAVEWRLRSAWRLVGWRCRGVGRSGSEGWCRESHSEYP